MDCNADFAPPLESDSRGNQDRRNAENVLRIDNGDLTGQYAAYIDGLVQRYRQ